MITAFAVGVLVYLAAGLAVVSFAKRDHWIESVRWWHVVFWPVVLIGYGLVLLGFWMAGDR